MTCVLVLDVWQMSVTQLTLQVRSSSTLRAPFRSQVGKSSRISRRKRCRFARSWFMLRAATASPTHRPRRQLRGKSAFLDSCFCALGMPFDQPQNDAAFFSFGSSTYWPTLRTPDTAIPIGFAGGLGELVALRTCVRRTYRTHLALHPHHTPNSEERGRRTLEPDTQRFRCRYSKGGT